jgi:hypothetical protein
MCLVTKAEQKFGKTDRGLFGQSVARLNRGFFRGSTEARSKALLAHLSISACVNFSALTAIRFCVV